MKVPVNLYRIFFLKPKECNINFGDKHVEGIEYGQIYFNSFNFSASGVINGVRNNFVLPAECYSTLTIYIHTIQTELNLLTLVSFRGTN
jgi:hypothetical protein